MAGQDLSINMKTTSDVPQAMEKAKSAVVTFDKQVEDIQKKFSTAFKDIFLGFTAPMVILQSAISFISGAIAQAKADAQAGLDLMAKGNTIYASEEEKKLANFIKAKKAREKEMNEVTQGKREMTEEFLKTPEGQALLAKRKAAEDALYGGTARRTRMSGIGAKAYNDPSDPALQAAALKAFLNSEEGKAYKPIFEDEKNAKAGTFKGPEGFGTVIGVGANPVMEKMTRQNEILEEIKEILWEQTKINHGGEVPLPFTDRVPISLQKTGAI